MDSAAVTPKLSTSPSWPELLSNLLEIGKGRARRRDLLEAQTLDLYFLLKLGSLSRLGELVGKGGRRTAMVVELSIKLG